MSSTKIAETADLTCLTMAFGVNRRCDNANFEATAAESAFERRGHGVRGLSDGDDKNALVRIQIVQVFADAKYATLAVHVPGEGAFDGGVLERRGKDFAGDFAHASELVGALGSQVGHERDYRDCR